MWSVNIGNETLLHIRGANAPGLNSRLSSRRTPQSIQRTIARPPPAPKAQSERSNTVKSLIATIGADRALSIAAITAHQFSKRAYT
jgi:hypothetical protein